MTFFEGAPDLSEIVAPAVSILTVIGIIPFTAALARQAWVKYTLTSRRIKVGYRGDWRIEQNWQYAGRMYADTFSSSLQVRRRQRSARARFDSRVPGDSCTRAAVVENRLVMGADRFLGVVRAFHTHRAVRFGAVA